MPSLRGPPQGPGPAPAAAARKRPPLSPPPTPPHPNHHHYHPHMAHIPLSPALTSGPPAGPHLRARSRAPAAARCLADTAGPVPRAPRCSPPPGAGSGSQCTCEGRGRAGQRGEGGPARVSSGRPTAAQQMHGYVPTALQQQLSPSQWRCPAGEAQGGRLIAAGVNARLPLSCARPTRSVCTGGATVCRPQAAPAPRVRRTCGRSQRPAAAWAAPPALPLVQRTRPLVAALQTRPHRGRMLRSSRCPLLGLPSCSAAAPGGARACATLLLLLGEASGPQDAACACNLTADSIPRFIRVTSLNHQLLHTMRPRRL